MTEQPDQLDLTAETDDPAPSPAPERHLFFLTNRFNLLHILSSRLIGPIESYPKHYKDLLDEAPGYVVLLTEQPSAALAELVCTEGANNFPVLLTLPLESLPAGHADHDAALALPGALPLSMVDAIVFPSDEARRDHETRQYDNVPTDDRFTVDPAAFQNQSATREAVRAAIAQQARTSNQVSAEWRRLDAARGALSALLAAPTAGVTAAAVGRFLSQLSAGRWSPLVRIRESEAADHDRGEGRLLSAVVTLLDQVDRTKTVSGRRLLKDLERSLTEGDVDARVRTNLEGLRAYTTGDREFTSFKDSSSALVSAKALLLFLLRPSLEGQLEWDSAELNASDEVRLLALGLVGRATGATEMPVSKRSLALDDVTAARACVAVSSDSAELSVQVAIERKGKSADIMVENAVVRADVLAEDSLLTRWQRLEAPARDEAAVRLARELGLAVTTRVTLPAAARIVAAPDALIAEVDGEVHIERRVDADQLANALRNVDDDRASALGQVLEPDLPA